VAPDGALVASAASPARPLAEALSWLWRLGPVADTPEPGRVGIGSIEEAQELAAAVRERRLAGAVIMAAELGPEVGPVPARARREGVARFARGAAVFDAYPVFAGGEAVVRTRVGAHAVLIADRVLAVGADLVERWGRLSAMWALTAVEELLAEVLDRPLLKLPPLGSVRFDDLPGTAQHQLQGRDKTDSDVTRRIERLRRVYRDAGATLSVAVAGRALRDGRPVPPEEVWPRGIEALAAGMAEGAFEPVGHGWLHYDDQRSDLNGEVEPREFLKLSYEEAARRIDAALEWQREHLGRAPTFVAPAWGYSDGALRALAERRIPAWQRASPAPLISDGNPRETLIGAGGPGGVHRLDYGSLVRLAEAGLPPTPVLHGGLMDDRLSARVLKDAPGYARLMLARDAHRLPRVRGIRWIGCGELAERYAAHDASEVRGDQATLPPGAEAVLVRGSERRLVTGSVR
jgi:hypothetical protein